MKQQFIDLFESLRETWGKIGLNQRISIIMASGAVLAGLVTLMVISSQNSVVAIASGVTDQEASRITTILQQESIPYKMSNRGNEITVDKKNYHKARMKLAVEGIADTGGKGYKVFEQPSFGRSDYVQRLQHQVALQQELELTIKEFEEVESVRVHVVPPKRSLLVDPTTLPKASVWIKKSRMDLKPNSVKAIQNLVAHAVEGLESSNVTVVDEQGNLLSRDMADDSIEAIAEGQLKARKDHEAYLKAKVEKMLDGVLGQGKSRVQVNVAMTTDSVQEIYRTFNPTNFVVMNKTIQRSFEQTTDENTGVPGVPTNSPQNTNGFSMVPGATVITNLTKDVTYGNEEKTTTTTKIPGALTNTSASVIVDTLYEADPNGGGQMMPKLRQQQDLDNLRDAIMRTLGISDLNDITVIQMPFEHQTSDVIGNMQNFDKQMFYFDLVKQVLYLGLPLIFFLGFVRMWKKSPAEVIPLGVPVGEIKTGEEGSEELSPDQIKASSAKGSESPKGDEDEADEEKADADKTSETVETGVGDNTKDEESYTAETELKEQEFELNIPFSEEELMAGLSEAERNDMQAKIRKINNWIQGKPETAVRTVKNWLEEDEDAEREEVTDED